VAIQFNEAAVLAAMRDPEATVEIGGLSFSARTAAALDAGILHHGRGLAGHPLLRSVSQDAMRAHWFKARIAYWLNKPADPDLLQIMFVDFPLGSFLEAVEFASSVTFSTREHGSLNWVVASNDRASALDEDGAKVDIYPFADGWRWTRPSAALRAFSPDVDGYVNGHAYTLEEAMTQAAAARDVLRAEVTKLASRLGLKVAA
jgi:hypothetical protein